MSPFIALNPDPAYVRWGMAVSAGLIAVGLGAAAELVLALGSLVWPIRRR